MCAAYRNVLFEVTADDSAHRVVEALLAAERGDREATRWLNEPALCLLRCDADRLARLVPFAMLCLAHQLALHPRSALRIDAVRYASLARGCAPHAAAALLGKLGEDPARGVRHAARQVLSPIDSTEPLSMGDVLEMADVV
jgi:hypothetical protein